MTIDEDVAAALERLRRADHRSLKEIVNQTLRRGLEQRDASKKRKRSYTRPVALGPSLIGSLDDVSDAIAIAEGEDHK
ncbi:MAG TPA: hypothetical protein VFA12_00570 [Stellaceae bacterium]|nr:hypothetical protein [Stellaceae bacterium]